MGVEERRKKYLPGVVRPLISRFGVKLDDYRDRQDAAAVVAKLSNGIVYAEISSYVDGLNPEVKGKIVECGWGHTELGPFGLPRGVSVREAATRYANSEDHVNLSRPGLLNLNELTTLTLLAGIADHIWSELQKLKNR